MSNNQKFLKVCWLLGLTGALLLTTIKVANAQSKIVPDNTLAGSEKSHLQSFDNLGLPIDVITGGAIRGQNLFHSFQEFNVSEGRAAYFFSPTANIQNILARVTGNNPSEILGTIGTFGNSHPNLFLINPNGIIFGANASLDVGGSFVATTANAIGLGDTGSFSASSPLTSNLLSINPSALFFNAVSHQAEITNDSTANTTVLGISFRDYWDSSSLNPVSFNGLEVPDGKSLLLLGGNVKSDGGFLAAFGGRIELGGLAAPGKVGLKVDGDNLSLSFPEQVQRANVSLTNGSTVDVLSGGGGYININANNVDVLQGSNIIAGIRQGSGSIESKDGDININATGTVTADTSLITNTVLGVGKGGDVNISGQTVNIINGSNIGSTSVGEGEAGKVNISAEDAISLYGQNPSFITSDIASVLGFNGDGNGGDINLKAPTISLRDGSQITSINLLANGNAGNIKINALDSFLMADDSGIQTVTTGKGNAGDVIINAGNKISLNSGAILTGTVGEGNGGNVTITDGNTVTLDGSNSQINSTLQPITNFTGIRKAGDINIQAKSVAITNGAEVNSSTSGNGNAGNIFIQADNFLSLTKNSQIFNTVESTGDGNGGVINIKTSSLLNDGSTVESSTYGHGNAGNIFVKADDICLFNRAFIAADTHAQGNGGSIMLDINNLSVRDGSEVSSSNFSDVGKSNAGTLLVHANNLVEIIGTDYAGKPSFLASAVDREAIGNGGDLNIETKRLSVRDGGEISTSTSGKGNAGNIFVKASDSVDLSGEGSKFPGGIFAQVNLAYTGEQGSGNGGKLTIETGNLSISDGSKVQASTFGFGNAGDLLINANNIEVFDTGKNNFFSTGIFNEVADPSFDATDIPGNNQRIAIGNAGNLTINTNNLSVRNGGEVSVSSRSQGNAGKLSVEAKDSVEVVGVSSKFGSSILSAGVTQSGKGFGGNLTIDTAQLSVRDGGEVLVNTLGNGDAGTLTVNANKSVEIIGKSLDGQFNSELSAAVGSNSTGKGGSLNINTPQLNIRDGGIISSRSDGQKQAGDININVGNLQADQGQIQTNAIQAGGGNITINAKDIRLRHQSDIRTNSSQGDGGNIFLGANTIVALEDSDILAFAPFGKGGNITFNTKAFLSDPLYHPSAPITDPAALNKLTGNGRVDVNASGKVSGVVSGVPDITFIQNSLTKLPQNLIDPNALIANSCIARSGGLRGTFKVVGSGGLPNHPGDASASAYPTGDVHSIHRWKIGSPIVEPQGVYRLPNGRLLLSRECH